MELSGSGFKGFGQARALLPGMMRIAMLTVSYVASWPGPEKRGVSFVTGKSERIKGWAGDVLALSCVARDDSTKRDRLVFAGHLGLAGHFWLATLTAHSRRG